MVKDIGLEVIRKGFTGFCPAWRFCPVFRPIIVAQLGFFVFFQLVCVIVSRKALRGLIAGYLTPEVHHGTVSGGMAFFLAVDYGIAGTFGAVRIFKYPPGQSPGRCLSFRIAAGHTGGIVRGLHCCRSEERRVGKECRL